MILVKAFVDSFRKTTQSYLEYLVCKNSQRKQDLTNKNWQFGHLDKFWLMVNAKNFLVTSQIRS